MQPIVVAKDGAIRFLENRIIRDLLETSSLCLNKIAVRDYTDDERMQLAQLIGYSVSGYGELSYVSDESYSKADDIRESIHSEMSLTPNNREALEIEKAQREQMEKR